MIRLVFHIGHHKTGTTWMQQNYFKHLEEFNLINDYNSPWNDELCREIIQKKNAEKCRSIITERSVDNKINIISAERLSGHPISGGFDTESTAKCLHSISSSAKVIIVKRKPENFIHSTYRQIVREGYRGKFKNYLYEPHWKTTGPSKKYFLQEKIVTTYIDLFGKDNVLILDFEDFIQDKSHFLDKLNTFLELDIRIENVQLDELVGVSNSDKKTKALRFLNRYRKTEYNPHPTLSLGDSLLRVASVFLAVFYSNKSVTDADVITKYLNEK